MGSWCAENLYDVQAWRDHGLEMTASSNEAAKLFDGVLRQLVSWIDCEQLGGIEKTSNNMLAAEPDFLMGKVLTLGMHAIGTGHSVHKDKEYEQKLADMLEQSRKCTSRERKHALAVNYFAQGEMQSACIEWEKILAEHPNDLLAVKFAHDGYFFLGDCYGKRDSVERVIHKWKPEMPCYSYLHGMLAFGLEESGQYDSARKHAETALEMNRQDCWATHAIAHCNEMEGKYKEGLNFMESTVGDWSPCWMLACHNFWHTALYYIEQADYESALSIYDREICDRSKATGMMLDMVDAASLLLRLEMEGVNLGHERWKALKCVVEPHIDDHTLTFNDAHIAMVLSRLEDDSEDLVDKHASSINNFVKAQYRGDNAHITRDLGEAICEAIVDHKNRRFEAAFDKMYPIWSQVYRIGGSHAQRDVFTQVLIHSGLNSPNYVHKQRAIDIIEERRKMKPNSPLIDRLLEKHKKTEHH
ncbi:tetratricopeptide repeat protein 38 [Ditylenchus destructor]|uniref:Tetratricopeptide repeat protein 38 n=1 Tax=Ditylenchus destructor TaxID=166010 RepID=A0AAD4N7P7_9BILA|nr:tetratricopeptide repeat protein 38 [Ditylenchus destructor]